MRKLLTTAAILGGLGLSCFAQSSESLLIGPGDTVAVEVFDTPEMEQHVRVTDAGNVHLEFLGDIHVAGETYADAARTIEAALVDKKVMKHPQVTITVEHFGTQEVSVLGQVHAPGVYAITTPQPITKLLSLAGGLTALADRQITIERHSDPTQIVRYYLANDAQQALTTGVLIYPGDSVIVSTVGIVYVLGDVGKPGGYPIDTNDSQLTALQAITLAGSPNKTAALSKALLIRHKDGGLIQETLHLASIIKAEHPDRMLQPNDVIYVPSSAVKNVMLNASSIVASATSALIYAHP